MLVVHVAKRSVKEMKWRYSCHFEVFDCHFLLDKALFTHHINGIADALYSQPAKNFTDRKGRLPFSFFVMYAKETIA